MFFLAKKENNKELNLKDKLKEITIDSIKSYTKGALLGAFLKKPDLETMNSSGIKMVKLDLFRNTLNNFFDNFMEENQYLGKDINYMPLSSFIAGSTLGIDVEEDEDIFLKDRIISGLSYSAYTIFDKNLFNKK